jgi:thiopurine S-methyltransferase
VLVPLRQVRDMLWLREQGHPVDGFELSELAITVLTRTT